jgi:hypothetical protein
MEDSRQEQESSTSREMKLSDKDFLSSLLLAAFAELRKSFTNHQNKSPYSFQPLPAKT